MGVQTPTHKVLGRLGYEGFQVFKGFHGLFFKKGRGYPEAKVPEDLWGCNRENIFTGKPWDGVGAKGREPVFRVKIIIEKALLCGKKNRAFLVKVTSFVGEVLRDREAFILSGKREGRGTAWRLGRPTYKVGREGVVLRLDHQGLFGVDVPLTDSVAWRVFTVGPKRWICPLEPRIDGTVSNGRQVPPLARRIEGWSPKPCVCQPARKTRSTEVMKMKGVRGNQTTRKLKGRPRIEMQSAGM